jgi:surface antigen
MVVVVLSGLMCLFVGGLAQPAIAQVGGGYPYADAVCEFGSAGGPSCANPANPGDLYDWGYWIGSNFDAFDPWGYEYRNCTSYVAWRLSQAGVDPALFSSLGNATNWINGVAGEPGVTVNDNPSPGAVAVWDSPSDGHVAWVEAVSGSTVTVSDYNYLETGGYDEHVISSAPTGYIHFQSGTSGSTSLLAGYVSTSGTFAAKEGSLGAGWVTEATGAQAISLAGSASSPLIGYLSASGTFAAKEGSLGAGWVTEATGARTIALAGSASSPLIGYLSASGTFAVKQGIGGPWVTEATGAQAISLAGSASSPLIGYLSASGTFAAKEGSLGAGWVTEATGAQAISLAGN